ncbi:MAG: WG repeat-containing protein, partial [Planctomycetota bacterium]
MNPHSRTLLVTLLLCLAAALVGCPVTGGGIRIASDDPPVNSPARETIVAADGRSYTVVERRADGTIEIADGETHGGRNHGLLAADGTVIVPAEHGTIMELHDGTAWVLDEKWGKVDQTGKVVVPFRYDY